MELIASHGWLEVLPTSLLLFSPPSKTTDSNNISNLIYKDVSSHVDIWSKETTWDVASQLKNHLAGREKWAFRALPKWALTDARLFFLHPLLRTMLRGYAEPRVLASDILVESMVLSVASLTDIFAASVEEDSRGFAVQYVPCTLVTLIRLYFALTQYELYLHKYFLLFPSRKAAFARSVEYTYQVEVDSAATLFQRGEVLPYEMRKLVLELDKGINTILRCYRDHLKLFTFSKDITSIIDSRLHL
jgi:hypothetical protein